MLETRGDAFVVVTNLEYPVDINLLYDAVRKAIAIAAKLSAEQGLPVWRQGGRLIRQIKKIRPQLQRLKRSKARDEKQRHARNEATAQAYRDYLEAKPPMEKGVCPHSTNPEHVFEGKIRLPNE